MASRLERVTGKVPSVVRVSVRAGENDPEVREWLYRHPGVAGRLIREMILREVRSQGTPAGQAAPATAPARAATAPPVQRSAQRPAPVETPPPPARDAAADAEQRGQERLRNLLAQATAGTSGQTGQGTQHTDR